MLRKPACILSILCFGLPDARRWQSIVACITASFIIGTPMFTDRLETRGVSRPRIRLRTRKARNAANFRSASIVCRTTLQNILLQIRQADRACPEFAVRTSTDGKLASRHARNHNFLSHCRMYALCQLCKRIRDLSLRNLVEQLFLYFVQTIHQSLGPVERPHDALTGNNIYIYYSVLLGWNDTHAAVKLGFHWGNFLATDNIVVSFFRMRHMAITIAIIARDTLPCVASVETHLETRDGGENQARYFLSVRQTPSDRSSYCDQLALLGLRTMATTWSSAKP